MRYVTFLRDLFYVYVLEPIQERLMRRKLRRDADRIMGEWLESFAELPRKTEEELRVNPMTAKLIDQMKIEHISNAQKN